MPRGPHNDLTRLLPGAENKASREALTRNLTALVDLLQPGAVVAVTSAGVSAWGTGDQSVAARAELVRRHMLPDMTVVATARGWAPARGWAAVDGVGLAATVLAYHRLSLAQSMRTWSWEAREVDGRVFVSGQGAVLWASRIYEVGADGPRALNWGPLRDTREEAEAAALAEIGGGR